MRPSRKCGLIVAAAASALSRTQYMNVDISDVVSARAGNKPAGPHTRSG